MRQSSYLPTALPAVVVIWLGVAALTAAPVAAQETHRLKWNENFRRDPDPGGALLASVEAGAAVPVVGRQGAWFQITLEGWIWAASVRPEDREGHDLVVAVPGGENLRTEPNGARIARLSEGTLLDTIERRGGWVRVRRTGWMFGQSLEPAAAAGGQGRRGAPAPGSAAPAGAESAGLDRAVTRDRTVLHRAPRGAAVATLAQGAPLKVLARSGGWVKVQAEGWVSEEQLEPGAPGVLVGVTAAELRSRPREFQGKLLQWTVQFISIQPADELRPEIPEGRPWVLARGPQPEQGFIYLIVDDAGLERFRRLTHLAEVVILGRVTAPRSRYLQVPVLEVLEIGVK